MRFCAHCAVRPAEVIDQVDGRLVMACRKCVNEETPDPGRTDTGFARERLRWALRFNPGATAFELFTVLGVPAKNHDLREYNRYWSALHVMFVGREVYRTGPHNRSRYWLAHQRSEEKKVRHAHA